MRFREPPDGQRMAFSSTHHDRETHEDGQGFPELEQREDEVPDAHHEGDDRACLEVLLERQHRAVISGRGA